MTPTPACPLRRGDGFLRNERLVDLECFVPVLSRPLPRIAYPEETLT